MRDKATVCFRRLADGNVIGEIIDQAGNVVGSRNFGAMSVKEYNRILELMQKVHPDIDSLPLIEMNGN